MEFSAVRQPIYNARKIKVAYQISFINREQLSNKCIPAAVFQDRSDPRNLNELLERAGIGSYSDNKTMVITFDRETLKGIIDYFFSSRSLVLELSPDEVFDAELLKLIRTARKSQYHIVLNEKALLSGNEKFLKYASHIKVNAVGKNQEIIQLLVSKAQKHGVRIIIENIASDEEFNQYRTLSVDFFKGSVFSKQDLFEVRNNKLQEGSLLNVFQHVMTEDYCYRELTDILASDSKLTHKLISLLNSVMYGREGNIYSIKQAICFIGENKMRKFISLLTAQELTDTRPEDIYNKATSRARFCELLAIKMGRRRAVVDRAFLSGLFSNLPDILGLDMEEALDMLKIHDDIKMALTGNGGELQQLVDMVIAYESADWEKLAKLTEGSSVSFDLVPRLYRQMLREMKSDAYLLN
ncbi:EAL and HDOD domain-containing protein [Photobacterium sp. OFAV2-7]|uniref:EAL and HDOD domain-containing protein n=1 Tax=Photobacterium sp. OFAV2-7 TaxID=2917748 RepID=UPI001EF6BF23|nr:HDOD domain-containing protein [Photobacterium sp. OFAV2-7]MCG7586077.1 HDOD domain-containing protein [Photobacterium sp. OFAV2-7]